MEWLKKVFEEAKEEAQRGWRCNLSSRGDWEIAQVKWIWKFAIVGLNRYVKDFSKLMHQAIYFSPFVDVSLFNLAKEVIDGELLTIFDHMLIIFFERL